MQKFFRSGGAFVVVALLCFVAGLTSESGTAFLGVGTVFLIIGMAARSKYGKKAPPEKKL